MIRRGLRLALGLVALATTLASGWALSQPPFAAPLTARPAAEVRAAVDRAMAREVDAPWMAAELETALAAEDTERLRILLRIADDRGVPVAPEQRAAAEAQIATTTGVLACARCALEPEACADIPQILACNLPLELTPVGDLNALRREGTAWLAGEAVDRVDVGLAAVGLGATGALLISGGTSASVKAGTTAFRVARKARLLPVGLSDEVTRLASASVRWDRFGDVARGRAGLETLIVAAPAARLRRLADDATRLRANTGTADTLALLRYADDGEGLARVARVSDALGPETRPAFAALGKARVFRLATRLTDLALATLALLSALAAQVLAFLLWFARRALR